MMRGRAKQLGGMGMEIRLARIEWRWREELREWNFDGDSVVGTEWDRD